MSLICFEGGARGIYESDLTQPPLPAAMIYDTTGQIKAMEGDVSLQNNKSRRVEGNTATGRGNRSVARINRLDRGEKHCGAPK